MKPTQDPKSIARQIAKQIASEPLEILKAAKSQVAGVEVAEKPKEKTSQPETKRTEETQRKEQVDRLKSVRRIEALNWELNDIEKQDKFKDLQKRISEGEEIPLEEYPELSMEQKQVLRAQMQAVRNQRLAISNKPLEEPAAKKGRQLFNFGKKQEMKRQQTHVEKIVPPSG